MNMEAYNTWSSMAAPADANMEQDCSRCVNYGEVDLTKTCGICKHALALADPKQKKAPNMWKWDGRTDVEYYTGN